MSTLISFLFLFLLHTNVSVTKEDPFVLQISNALEKTFDFVLKHSQSMNIDGIFGIIIGGAFLDGIDEGKFAHGSTLDRLKVKAALIYNTTRPRLLDDSDYKNRIFAKHLLDPEKWKRKVVFRSGRLDNSFIFDTSQGVDDNSINFINYVNSMQLNESFSDQCILELIIGANQKAGGCAVSPECSYEMTDRKGFGPLYVTTHRLLYLQIARVQNCIQNEHLVRQKIKSFCSYILWEAKTMEKFNLMKLLNDAFLEQITLCSMEGFAEFMKKNWAFEILNMQEDEGCYKATDKLEEARKKRTANIIEFGCTDHTTGLAASALSAFLNYYTMNVA